MTVQEWCNEVNSIDANLVLDGTHHLHSDYLSLVTSLYDADLPAVRFIRGLVDQTAGPMWELLAKKFKDFPIARDFVDLAPEAQRDVILTATSAAALHARFLDAQISRLHTLEREEQFDANRALQEKVQHHGTALGLLIEAGPSVKQPWDEASISLLLINLQNQDQVRFNRILRLVEHWAMKNNWTDALSNALKAVVDNYGLFDPKLHERAEDIGKPKVSDDVALREFELKPCDAWTNTLVGLLNQRNDEQQHAWTQLLAHCEGAKSSSPSKTFLKRAQGLIDEVGEPGYVKVLAPVLDSIGSAYGDPSPHEPGNPWVIDDTTLVGDATANILRGLVWTSSLVDDEMLLAALAGAADRCFQKVRGFGPRAPKIGNACLWVFGHSDSLEAVAQLNRLMGRVKHASVRKQIERSLNAAAEHHGLTRSDLGDMAVPTCGLTGVGSMKQSFGDFTAELTIPSTVTTKTVWHSPAGKTQKTVPKSVKEDFAAELKAWKANEKLLKQALAGQRDRLESFYQIAKQWTFPTWRERLLDHPLMGWFARRLIWNFDLDGVATPAMWHEEKLVNASDEAIAEPTAETVVTLWHPIDDTTEGIAAWREWMLAHEVTQPFKQAYREVYLLTDAERNTGTYSNRYAAHVIKQHQFRALCQARGWQYDLMGQWDSHNIPEKVLPAHNLRAEFLVDAAGDEEVSEAGIFLYLATDQVRFFECDADAYARDRWAVHHGVTLLTLDQIPPLVFSEIMRDVDLFVGVASVGNDPNWEDGGPEGRYRDYWYDTSFGDLSASAHTRREILERLVPKLKIADRCSFDEKFLIVRGDKRTYKIHLGSSNILMEPNDQYLCIVPGRGAGPGDKVFLPFEGDQRLAVILSKAIMLADDTKIKDPTILSQIGR